MGKWTGQPVSHHFSILFNLALILTSNLILNLTGITANCAACLLHGRRVSSWEFTRLSSFDKARTRRSYFSFRPFRCQSMVTLGFCTQKATATQRHSQSPCGLRPRKMVCDSPTRISADQWIQQLTFHKFGCLRSSLSQSVPQSHIWAAPMARSHFNSWILLLNIRLFFGRFSCWFVSDLRLLKSPFAMAQSSPGSCSWSRNGRPWPSNWFLKLVFLNISERPHLNATNPFLHSGLLKLWLIWRF